MTERFPWFSARLLFESLHPEEPKSDSLFEERIVLIRAESEDEAEEEAIKLGHAGREEYENIDGKKVVWDFKELLDLVQLNEEEISSGSQVYYHFLNEHELKSIRQSLKPGSL